MIACTSFSRLSRLSCTVSVTSALYIQVYAFQKFSYLPIIGGKKGGQSSLDNCNKQKVVLVWRPISTESVHTSKILKSRSTDPIMDTVNCDNSSPDCSTGGLVATLTSGGVDYKSEHEPFKQVEVIREPNKYSYIVNEAGKYSVSIQVDASLIRFIRGKWGLTQKQIVEETDVKIIFPYSKHASSIVIEGASLENVNRGCEKITNVLEQAVESPNFDYSHFISLPLAFHSELVEKLHRFQKSVLEEVNMIPGDMNCSSSDDSSDKKDDNSVRLEGSNITVKLKVQNNNKNVDADGAKLLKSSSSSAMGIDRSIFIKPQTFHLTVLMLKLWNKDLVDMATKILEGISSKVMDSLENRPVSIRLRGLACMKGSPAKAFVVYAPIEEVGGDGRLLRACQVIIDAYVESGLVLQKDALHSLKLHATLMNARHRKREMRTRRHDSFDARGIFKKYGSEDWGEYVISEAHLSQRFDFDESGYYHCCGSIPFPGSIKIE